jgi:hypothetical protein
LFSPQTFQKSLSSSAIKRRSIEKRERKKHREKKKKKRERKKSSISLSLLKKENSIF